MLVRLPMTATPVLAGDVAGVTVTFSRTEASGSTDEGIAGYSYTWVDRENRAGSTFALYGPAIGDGPIVASVNGVDVAPDMGFDDWTVLIQADCCPLKFVGQHAITAAWREAEPWDFPPL